jgi:aspartyl-tRNA(Asn)/glutamyl-tRNA(Gln) amidotransferase subunit A
VSLTELSAAELLQRLRSGEVSATDAAQACLARMEKVNERVNAIIRVDRKKVLADAAKVDQKRAAGQPVGALAGLPVVVKDLLCTQGEPTTCGSRMLRDFSPPYDATAVAKLRAADGVILGKANLDEFAMGGSTESSIFGPTRNPWDTSRVAGGSSGGSAAAVAASLAPLAIGTDTGGSIRQPAGLCGITGLKPTYGRISRYGLIAFASSLDQIGPMAHSAEDCALLLEVLAGHDPRDATSVDRPVPQYRESLSAPLKGLKLGVVKEHYGAGLDEEVAASVEQAIDVYRSLGAEIRDVELPHSKYGVATYYVIAPCEASSNLARYDGVHYGYRTDEGQLLAELDAERKQLLAAGDKRAAENLDTALVRMYRKSRSEGFGAEVKRRIMLGTYALSAGYYDAYYVKALKVRRLIRHDFDRAFEQVDLIVGPVTPSTAFKIGEKTNDPLAMYREDLYTVTANLAGIAGIAFPCGQSKAGLPIGVQLQSPPFQEETLLRAAHQFQLATDWHKRRPKL